MNTETTDHQPTTVYAGPTECIERDCEEFWDDEGEDRPGVGLCSHMAAERVCTACSEGPEEEGGYWQRTVAWPCQHIVPEPEGCHAWQLTPDNHSFVDHTIDKLGVFAKAYWQDVDGKLTVVGLRIGNKPGHVVAFYGDWIIRHPDGGFTVHKAPATDCPSCEVDIEHDVHCPTPETHNWGCGCDSDEMPAEASREAER